MDDTEELLRESPECCDARPQQGGQAMVVLAPRDGPQNSADEEAGEIEDGDWGLRILPQGISPGNSCWSRNRRWMALGGAVSIVVVVSLAVSLSARRADPPSRAAVGDPLSVVTPLGVLQGKTDGGVDRFFGIPYALPPTGKRRFMPAVPVTDHWQGAKDVTAMGSDCVRWNTPHDTHSEDCLFLNVRNHRELG